VTELKLSESGALTGKAATLRAETLQALGLKKDNTKGKVWLRNGQTRVVVVPTFANAGDNEVIRVSSSVMANFVEAGATGTITVEVSRPSAVERARLAVTVARVSPILAIVAGVVTAVAVFTGHADAAGWKDAVAAFALASGACAGWVGFQKA
jgi:hypothetical protein